MLILSEQPFRVAGYHRRSAPQDATQDLAQGPIATVEIEFEQWLGGRALTADAFVDLGSDNTWISFRWIREQAQAASASVDAPKIAPDRVLIEQAHLSIGGLRLLLGDSERPVVVTEQVSDADPSAQMPGFEDLLLGRDFLTQHGLLLVVDGARRTFSLLAPVDAVNRERRDRVLTMLAATDLL